jgi:hypothetical protein
MHLHVLERIFPLGPEFSSKLGVSGNLSQGAGETVEPLGRASVELVDEVCSKISMRQTRSEARLADLIGKLDAEEERGRRLEERIAQADNVALEAEVWLTRLTDAIKAQIISRGSGMMTAASTP